MYQPESIDQALSLLNKKLKREGITIELQIIHHHGADELKRHLKEIKEYREHLYAEFRRI